MPNDAADWTALKGLWLSGLFLEESLILSWDIDAKFQADLSGWRPCFRIDATGQRRDDLRAKFGGNCPDTGNAGQNADQNETSPTTVSGYRACAYKSEGDGARTRNHRIDSPVL